MSDEWRVADSLVMTELTAEQRRHAVRTVARNARDATDLAELLDMLGLSTEQTGAQSEPVATPPLRRIQNFAKELDELRKAEAARHVRRHHQPAATR